MGFNIYSTLEEDVKLCNDARVSLVGNWEIDLPENDDFNEDTYLFTLIFNGVDISVTVENERTRRKYQTKFTCPEF